MSEHRWVIDNENGQVVGEVCVNPATGDDVVVLFDFDKEKDEH